MSDKGQLWLLQLFINSFISLAVASYSYVYFDPGSSGTATLAFVVTLIILLVLTWIARKNLG